MTLIIEPFITHISSFGMSFLDIFGRGTDPERRETKEDFDHVVENSRFKISGLKFVRARVGVSRWLRRG